jgi:hypothetical protein
MLGFKNVSQPYMMSGLVASIRLQNSSRFAYILWKLISSVRRLLMLISLWPVCFEGDDFAMGEPGWQELVVELQLERAGLLDE